MEGSNNCGENGSHTQKTFLLDKSPNNKDVMIESKPNDAELVQKFFVKTERYSRTDACYMKHRFEKVSGRKYRMFEFVELMRNNGFPVRFTRNGATHIKCKFTPSKADT